MAAFGDGAIGCRLTGNLVYVKRILIVDDSPLIRHSLRSIFEMQQSEWAVCGEAENGSDGIDKAQKAAG
jgi:YesN/AraC family two-component response regulator